MKDLCKMTKEELIAKCRKLKAENKKLRDELDHLSDRYTELENQSTNETDSLNDFGW